MMNSRQSLIEHKLDPVGVSGDNIIYICPNPNCNDKSGHLYVTYKKEKFQCWKCGFKGRTLEPLLKVLGIDSDFDYSKLYSEQENELDMILAPKTPKSEVIDYSTNLNTLTEFYRYHIQPLSSRAYMYLRDRGLSDFQIQTLGICEGVSRYGETFNINGREYRGRNYRGRIMIPSLRKDELISFYVARDYTGTQEPKYLNPPSELAVASEDVWNLARVESESLLITEGVFTAISASPVKLNAVATYGKSIAKKSSNTDVNVTSQGEKLLKRKFKNYYVCYDADAITEAINTCQYLYDRGANVYLVVIDPVKYGKKADVADIGYSEFLKLLAEAQLYRGGLSALDFKNG